MRDVRACGTSFWERFTQYNLLQRRWTIPAFNPARPVAKGDSPARVGRRARRDHVLDKLLRLPGVYQALAFLTARRVVVRGPSMVPTLVPGEYVLFERLAYRRAPPRRGDVVLAAD